MKERRFRARVWSAALALSLAVPLVALDATPAEACGGFFCSQVPIDQSGEQIVFAVKEGHVTAHIQISFAGEAEDFAWVVPVASKPEISVGTQSLFTQLRSATEPQWYLNWDYQDQCGFWWGFAEDAAPSAGAGDGGNGVTVLETKEVGPYNTVTLESKDAKALIDWLNANGFDQPAESLPLIEHYLAQNMLFVALKLSQNAGVGDIQPVVLDFKESQPCVPLILTRIAAVADMPVRIWVLGEARAIPTNWFHVEINQKKIDWINGGSNYNDVVTAAVNEAAGHGFVTEFAGSTESWTTLVYNEGQYNLAALKAAKSPADFVMQLLQQGFPRDSQMQGLLRKHIPMPSSLAAQGVTEQQFYNCLECYAEALAGFAFDPEAFVADLVEKIIEPQKAAQAMLSAFPKITRLYTTVSPDEMNRDPLFDFNSELPDVSNVHQASAKAICGEDDKPQAVIITLEGGETFELQGPFDNWWGQPMAGGEGEPAADSITLMSTSGAGRVVPRETVEYYDQQLDTREVPKVIEELETEPDNGGKGNPATTGPKGVVTSGSGSGSSGCGASGGAAGIGGLLLVGLAALRRRIY
ncbi:MAG: hypothetical protein AMXMBFR64_21990 [Myxococcales bacterium]